ncbi:hypothetical protein E6W39_21970 [Kitasatospora acidiphila]|uniref:Uncharacterized protein n=1 Tax=Kitasatospora acidiphila TaxID=2567942 RepID=A0A540W5V2_9ACTN|nr:hypothetical protein [Kitasatospora acidiphila]TQF04401.1 hypothetical protein E6W39_21970 [Kitasatospora acidiphila]
MSEPGVPQRFLELAAAAMAPQQLSDEGLLARFGFPEEVRLAAGQVWRACWEETSLLVLILALATREVQAVPVTIDPPGEDAASLVVDGTRTAFGVEATVWAGLSGPIPMRVLDRVVDSWEPDLVAWAAEMAAGGAPSVPAGARKGVAPVPVFGASEDVRADLEDDLEALRAVPGLPAAEGSAKVVSLKELLKGSLPDLPALGTALGLSQPQVMRILRGSAPVAPGQVEAVAKVTGLSVEAIAATVRPLPPALVTAAEHPRWRQAWRRRAQRLSVSEEDARLTGGYEAFALAARETGGAEPDWEGRLRQFMRGEDLAGSGA